MTRQRLDPEQRRAAILNAAIQIAAQPGGWAKLTREAIARVAKCSEALPSRYFGTMSDIRSEVMGEAINRRELPVIAQGLACGHPVAIGAPDEIKTAALKTLAQ